MSKTPEEIQADIERQREQLAQTVDQLGPQARREGPDKAKVEDVKAQTKAKVGRGQGPAAPPTTASPGPRCSARPPPWWSASALLVWLRRRR